MSLSFHQTFPLECENIAKLLAVAAEKANVSNTEIAELTGIGIGKNDRKGKVQPTIEYATYSGLISIDYEQGGRRIRLTDVGRMILEKDRQLKKPVTQWVMHYHLSRLGGEAEAWTYLIHEFLPFHSSFDRALFEKSAEQRFGERASLRSIKPGLVLSSYTESRGLGLLRLVRESNRQYFKGHPYIPTPHIVGYTLAEVWEAKHPLRMMVAADDLSGPGHLGPTIGLKDSDLQEQLNRLTHLGIIGQMREAPPYQIVRQWDDKFGLLRKAYEEED